MAELKDLIGRRKELQDQMDKVFKAGGPDLKLNADQRNEITTLDKELADLGDSILMAERKAKNEADLKAYEQPAYKFSPSAGEMESKDLKDTRTIAERIMDAPQFKSRGLNGGKFTLEIPGLDVKTLMTLSAGFAPPNDRTDKVVPYALRGLMAADLYPTTNTNLQVVKWMEETTHTDNAAVAAEGSAPTDSAFVFTERTATMEKIVAWLPVSDEQLEDVDGIQSLVQNRLGYQVQRKMEAEVVSGTYGVLNFSSIQSQALGALSQPDAFYTAINLVRHTGFAEPNAGLIHPDDWLDIQLLQDNDGNYIWGNPAAPIQQPRIWGIPLAVTTVETTGTAVIGDFARYSELYIKRGLTIEVSDSHSTYFTEGKKAIKATIRMIPACYRGAAFCKVTGL